MTSLLPLERSDPHDPDVLSNTFTLAGVTGYTGGEAGVHVFARDTVREVFLDFSFVDGPTLSIAQTRSLAELLNRASATLEALPHRAADGVLGEVETLALALRDAASSWHSFNEQLEAASPEAVAVLSDIRGKVPSHIARRDWAADIDDWAEQVNAAFSSA